MKFVADTMLGKLARWLRILGYDTMHESSASLDDQLARASQPDTVFLTRRKSLPDGSMQANVYYVKAEKFDAQLREVVHRFGLDIECHVFTRCLDCNVEVQPVAKDSVRGKVPEKSFDGFDTFFQCPTCQAISWSGVHLTNTKNKLKRIFSEQSTESFKE